jgi:hypothetical protein
MDFSLSATVRSNAQGRQGPYETSSRGVCSTSAKLAAPKDDTLSAERICIRIESASMKLVFKLCLTDKSMNYSMLGRHLNYPSIFAGMVR